MDTSHNHTRRKAVGVTIAAAPPMQDLRDKAVDMLESGRSRSEVEAYLRNVAVNDPAMGLRVFLGINRKVARFSAAQIVAELGKRWSAALSKKKVQDVLSDYAARTGVDRWVADYILGWIDEGEPPAIAETNVKWVGDFSAGPEGDKTKMVGVIVNGLADPREAAQDFLDQCARSFPPETWARRGMAVRDAERVRLFAEGLTDFDIAKQELEVEGYDLIAANKREYNREVDSRANSVLQSRRRWSEYLTNLLEPLSPNPD